MIDLNGPDIEAVDEVKALILESVNTWKNYKKRMPSRISAGVTRAGEHRAEIMFTLNSRDLRMWVSMIQRSRGSNESRMSVMFLKHWVTTSVTPEYLSRMCLRLLT
jgi:hypothetical protein